MTGQRAIADEAVDDSGGVRELMATDPDVTY